MSRVLTLVPFRLVLWHDYMGFTTACSPEAQQRCSFSLLIVNLMRNGVYHRLVRRVIGRTSQRTAMRLVQHHRRGTGQWRFVNIRIAIHQLHCIQHLSQNNHETQKRTSIQTMYPFSPMNTVLSALTRYFPTSREIAQHAQARK